MKRKYIIATISGLGLLVAGVIFNLGAVSHPVEMGLGELVRQADAVFIGEVMVEPTAAGKPLAMRSERRFRVIERLKGEVGAEVTMGVLSSLVEDRGAWTQFEAGERYLMFVVRAGQGYQLVGGAQGRYRIEEQTTDGRVLLWRVVRGSEEEVEVEETYLDEVKAEVSRILGEEGQR